VSVPPTPHPPVPPGPELDAPSITPRARSREDKAGDPLDGLVNLFDLGIVLAVAFLLAALSSVNITSSVLTQNKDGTKSARTADKGSVIKKPDEVTQKIPLNTGETVVGKGTAVGTVYLLDDGTTVLVRKASPGAPATTTTVPVPPTGTPPATTTGTPPAGGTATP